MESENYKIIRDFISDEEKSLIVNWISNKSHSGEAKNVHLKELGKTLSGNSFIFDISKTQLTQYITNFQSVSDPSSEEIPDEIMTIIFRVSKKMNFPTDNIFLQAVDMNKGGKIDPHYDASIEGYINYKCNISVLSEDYNLYLDRSVIRINSGDLYGFEASLYKHWTDEFNSRRVFLSIGFLIPYSVVGRTSTDPRVRLSRRIEKYFQNTH